MGRQTVDSRMWQPGLELPWEDLSQLVRLVISPSVYYEPEEERQTALLVERSIVPLWPGLSASLHFCEAWREIWLCLCRIVVRQ